MLIVYIPAGAMDFRIPDDCTNLRLILQLVSLMYFEVIKPVN
jgi:hypothetical protein